MHGAGGGSGYINTTELTNACMYGYNVAESAATATKTVSTLAHSETPTAQTAKIGNGYAKISWEEDFDPYVTVGDLYDACVANHVTPVSHNLNDIVAVFLNSGGGVSVNSRAVSHSVSSSNANILVNATAQIITNAEEVT